jgi:hypothetical protein
MAITARGLKTLAPGRWLAESARGEGQLRAKGSTKGPRFYFRYRRVDNTTDDLPLGRYDPDGKSGLTLDQAKATANAWRMRYKAGERDLRSALESDARQREHETAAREAAAQAASEAAATRRTRTLGALLTAYADQLQRDGKPSAREVRAALKLHAELKWPKLWAKPIADITSDDLLAIVATVAADEHLRQAEKLRAYLRAAFSAGMRARRNAKALPALRDLGITTNPARDLTPIEGANNARDRALSIAELRAYWQQIQAPEHAALRFHLLTGCQRLKQLARAKQADFDEDTLSLRILDRKGRRSAPRQHHFPLLPAAVDAMHDMHVESDGPYVFTFTSGRSGADYSGIYRRIQEIVSQMLEADELPGGAFTPGDLRRTVETRLADKSVSSDVRGQLQSHGLSGVQHRHYDRADYLPQTRAALETLYTLLTDTEEKAAPEQRKAKRKPNSTGAEAKVIPIRGKAKQRPSSTGTKAKVIPFHRGPKQRPNNTGG